MQIISGRTFVSIIISLIIIIVSCEEEITSPYQISRIDIGTAYYISVENQTAYLVNNKGIVIINVSNPYNPYEIGTISNDIIAGFHVLNDTIVVSGRYYTIYDVKDSGNPVEIGQYTGKTGRINAVTRKGKFGSLIYFDGGIDILDLSSINRPRSIGYSKSSWQGNDMALLGNFIYVANSMAGLEIIDITDPGQPVIKEIVSGTSGAWDIHFQNNLLFLGCHMYGCRIIDISYPFEPVVIGSLNTGGEIYGVCSWQNQLAIADLQKGVFIYDISDPTNPIKIAEDKSYHPHNIWYDGTYIFLADQDKGFVILKFQ